LGFGLSAILCVSTAAADEAPAPPRARLYTNEDLDRVRPFRDETGVRSVPAVAPDDRPAPARAEERPHKRGEEYWRREASRVRDRVRAMEAQATELRARIAERESEASRWLTRRRRSASTDSGSNATLQAKLATLERRMRQLEEDLADRARREGALPGWLR
jgi:predicted RNase H-like nuclease (RuvC/YqgF family)